MEHLRWHYLTMNDIDFTLREHELPRLGNLVLQGAIIFLYSMKVEWNMSRVSFSLPCRTWVESFVSMSRVINPDKCIGAETMLSAVWY